MKKKTELISGELKFLGDLPHSKNGGPRLLVSVGDVTCRTEVDSPLGYGLPNHWGEYVTVEVRDHYGHLNITKIHRTLPPAEKVPAGQKKEPEETHPEAEVPTTTLPDLHGYTLDDIAADVFRLIKDKAEEVYGPSSRADHIQAMCDRLQSQIGELKVAEPSWVPLGFLHAARYAGEIMALRLEKAGERYRVVDGIWKDDDDGLLADPVSRWEDFEVVVRYNYGSPNVFMDNLWEVHEFCRSTLLRTAGKRQVIFNLIYEGARSNER